MARRRLQRPALLIRVLTDIGSGQIYEQYLRDKDTNCLLHGESEGRTIRINPAVAICDTLIHETLHRLEPEWHENYVRNRTSYLLYRMSDEQIQQLYETYEQIRKRRRKRAKSRVQQSDSGDPGDPRGKERRLRVRR